jgi:FkbM family methyltransferase
MAIVKDRLLRFLRRKVFQSMWTRLSHVSRIGMNYWGGATVGHSGERSAVSYAANKLTSKNEFVVFDVGANLGQFALMAGRVIGSKAVIYSFEPSKATFDKLRSNENIRAFNIGLGEREEVLKLFSPEPTSSVASLYPHNKTDRWEQVQIITLDAFCTNENIHSIDYLKLDIEGHEFFVLKGATKLLSEKRIKFIQFEFGEFHIDSRTYFRDFYNLLEKDYDLYRVVSDGLVLIKEYTPELEVFATANYLAELR